MSYENLKQAVLAVEENNRINDGKWSDWSSADHVADTYEIGELSDAERAILENAIKSNGASIDADMNAVHNAEYGVEFNTWR